MIRRFWNSTTWWWFANRPTTGTVFDIVSISPGSGQLNLPYSQTFTTVNGNSPYTWNVFSGALPPGLTLGSSTGVVSGTPTGVGSYTFALRVVDVGSLTAIRTFTLVIAAVRLSGVIEAELSGKGNGWTILVDVLMRTGISFHRGLPGTKVTDRVADASTLRWDLDNSERSLRGLGCYSPDHSNKLPGFDLNIGIRYRIGSVIRFTGILDDIDIVPGTNAARTVSCTAVGWFDTAQRTRLSNLPILQNQRGDIVFQALIDSLSPISRPLAVEKDASPSTLPYTLDRTRDEQTLLRDELYRVAMSELALCWERGDGTVVWESRSRRATTSSDIATFTDAQGFLASRNRTSIINNAQTTIHPRKPATVPVVLYILNTITAISPGQVMNIEGPWTDPANPDKRVGAVSLEPLVPIFDYKINTQADGLGTDLTNQLIVTTGLSGNATAFTIILAGSTSGFIILLRQRGSPLYDYGPSVLKSEDPVSIQQWGISQPQNVDMPYQDDANFGQEVAQYIVFTNSQPHTQVSAPFTRFVELNDTVEILQSINRDISDRIRIIDPVTGLNRSFFIQAIDEIEQETTLKTQWTLMYADSTAFWLLEVVGRGELDLNTRPGFGLILGHTDITHIDVHSDNLHNDVTHSDSHTDNPHTDLAHGDGGVHGDSAHSDTGHSDVSHADSHGDSGHVDEPHEDVRYSNSHTDIPHSDIPHEDSAHADVLHGDVSSHGDVTTEGGIHSDLDVHQDVAHVDTPHTDIHNDTAHGDQHNDSQFIDEAHEDIAHSDAPHGDTNHGDTLHSDIPHYDSAGHSDTPPASFPHGDVAHIDVAHGDVKHGDTHGDKAHGDIN